jgi:transglutaminase-like putative cysteine protease
MKVMEAVRRANRPGPPEDSVRLRVLIVGAATVGLLACRAEGEVSWWLTIAAIGLLATGMAFSHATRARPVAAVKPALAFMAIVAFVWFFTELRAHPFTDIGGVEGLLAALFAWIQVTHAFDVPARRDLSFSLAGSAGLIAVAGAQAIDLGFGLYVVVWGALSLGALFAMWGSAGGGAPTGRGAPTVVVTVVMVGLVALLALPAPQVAGNISFPSDLGSAVAVVNPAGLAGDGGRPSEPSRPGTSIGRTRVGGYLGFATHLDTALRGSLGDQLVMRVRAQRPSYWVGETFDTWTGQSWLTTRRVPQAVATGSPFTLPLPDGAAIGGTDDLQTFYVVAPNPNLVFHADSAHVVWFPADTLFVQPDGAILSPVALGPGTVYTVESIVSSPTPEELRATSSIDGGLSGAQQRQALQLPHPYPHVQALAEAITARAPTTYDKVQALIAWMGSHTRYSTDIPPLPSGADAVDQFLFSTRVGFCEQISTSLAVMLRSIGIPAREAAGYVPGPYDPITDLYEVQAKDAHAWVQVWFPTYGWQSFDPTANVPLANPSPGATLVGDATHALGRVGLVPIGLMVAAAAAIGLAGRAWRRRPRSWAEKVTRRIERAGRRAGRERRPSETLREYAAVLDARRAGAPDEHRAGAPDEHRADGADRRRAATSASWSSLAWALEQDAYSATPIGPEARRHILRLSAQWRVPRRLHRPAPYRAVVDDGRPERVGAP